MIKSEGSSAASQQASSSGNTTISGVISDPTGVAVPNVSIEAVNQATGKKFAARTNKLGKYKIRHVKPGTYALRITVAGFRRFSKSIVVSPEQSARVDAKLEVSYVEIGIVVMAARD